MRNPAGDTRKTQTFYSTYLPLQVQDKYRGRRHPCLPYIQGRQFGTDSGRYRRAIYLLCIVIMFYWFVTSRLNGRSLSSVIRSFFRVLRRNRPAERLWWASMWSRLSAGGPQSLLPMPGRQIRAYCNAWACKMSPWAYTGEGVWPSGSPYYKQFLWDEVSRAKSFCSGLHHAGFIKY